MKKYDHDLIVIGLGPAGMAVAIMASAMGLKVCAIEKHKVGGECMNVGCIPSKALLRMGKTRAMFDKLGRMELAQSPKPDALNPFSRIQESLDFISQQKTMRMFDKVHMVYQQGAAEFVDPHTVAVGGKTYTAQRIFICVGTRPAVPNFPGIDDIDYLTNETMFSLETIPKSLLVAGGGAIACEMAQAFSRLGSKVTILIRGPRLMWREDRDATDLLETTFENEGITILREQKPAGFENRGGKVWLKTDKGHELTVDKVLIGAGRKMDFSAMNLTTAGVNVTEKGAISVNKHLQTSQKHIYAVGDCNGYFQFSHAAMHQGMLALINSMAPRPFKQNFLSYPVPWTVFTEPQISRVGASAGELDKRGVKYETFKVNYSDYGAAIAEAVEAGFVKVHVSKTGRILGAMIVGEGSGEMINEWTLAVQNKTRIHQIMMQQHSFPTMGFLSKRVAETWMMDKMKSSRLQRLCQWMYRL